MITLTSYPQGDTSSRYYAVHNPLNFTFTSSARGAGAFNTYNLSSSLGGGGNILRFTPDQGELLTPGDVIIFNDSSIHNIQSIQNISGQAVVNVSPGTSLSGLNFNIKSINNYRAEIRLFHGRKELTQAGQLLMPQVGPVTEATPDASGIIRFNVQPFLKPFIESRASLSLSKKNTVSRGLWGRFFIQYRERWDGDGKDSESGWIPSMPGAENMRYWASGVRQLLSGGVTMNPFNRQEGSVLGQFTTAFKQPEYLIGFPENEISFIWQERTGFEFLKFREEKLNINKQSIAAATLTNLLTEGRQEVNRVRIGEYDHSGFVKVSVIVDENPSEGYVNPGYVLEGYFELI